MSAHFSISSDNPFASAYCSVCRIFVLWKWACFHQSVNSIPPDRWEPYLLFQNFSVKAGHPTWVSWAICYWQESAGAWNIYSFKPMKTDSRFSPEWLSSQYVFLGEIETEEWQALCEWQGLWGGSHPGLSASVGADRVLDFFLTSRTDLIWCSLHRKYCSFNSHHKQPWFSGKTKKLQTDASVDCKRPETPFAPGSYVMWWQSLPGKHALQSAVSASGICRGSSAWEL